jgi:hypothetical protein
MQNKTWLCLCAVGTLATVGCDSGAAADGGEPAAAALFLVNTTVFGADGMSNTYFAPLESLAAGTKLDTKRALEAPGMAKLYAREGLGWFALGGGEEPTVTRYDVDSQGTFTKSDSTISFQPRGTDFLGDTMVFVSDRKAYYFDAPNTQLIRWNPETMEIEGEIDLSMTFKDNLTTIYDVKPLLRGDGTLLFPVAWRNFETDATFPGTGLVVIDTAIDEVASYVEDERCQGITWSAVTPDGDLYAGTSPYYSVLQRVTGDGPEPCVLRVRAASKAFDPEYKVELATLVDGRIAGGLAPAGEGALFFRAIDPEVKVDASSIVGDVWADDVWTWQRWDLATDEVTAVAGLAPSAAGGLTYEVDGRVYAVDAEADWSSSTLIDLTAEGGPRAALTATGYIYGAARIH